MRPRRPRAFTLIEVVAALAIVSIALLGLLQLHLLSIRMADKAQGTIQAVLLAQAKMAEALSVGFPPVGTRSGVVDDDDARFTWRAEVTDVSSQGRPLGLRLTHLRRLSVEVACGGNSRAQQVRLTTYVAENRIREL